MYNVKFLKGTSTQLSGITRDLNTFYYVDDTDLYLGNIKLSNGADLAAAILRIAANETDIDNLQKDIQGLTGGETGSISGMITEAVNAAKTELGEEISANTAAINAEKERAMGVEGGLETRLATVEGDYLKASDKTALEGKITEVSTAVANEKSRAEGIESGLNTRLETVENDIQYFFKDALKDEEGVQAYKDTLKEIQDYITSDATAAGEMTASIKANTDAIDAIKKDYLKAADKTELQGNIDKKADKTTVEGIDGRLVTVEGKIDNKAETSVVTELSGKVTTVEGKVTALEGKVDVAKVSEAIAAAKGEATKHADDAIAALDATVNSADVEEGKGIKITVVETDGKLTSATVSGNYDNKYDAKGAAGTAETNAKNYTDSLAKNYATAAQGAKADTAVQSVVTGSANGTIAVDGEDVAVKGLGSAAYTASTAYDAAGSANTAENNAKAYVDTALTWGTIA
jgi:hypothetical protein